MREGRDAERDGRCGAAARTTGRACPVPWIQRRAAELVVGVPTQAEGGSIAAADDNGAGTLPVGHRRTVGIGDQITEGNDAVGGRGTRLIDIFFDENRDTM